ncbi:hypothetical protein ACF0H5_021581 [Mactra antiquata]
MYLGVEFHKDVQKTLARYSSNFGDRPSTRSPNHQITEKTTTLTETKRSTTLEHLLSKERDSPDIMFPDVQTHRLNPSVKNYHDFMKASESKDTTNKVTSKFEDSVLFETKNMFIDKNKDTTTGTTDDNDVVVDVEHNDDNDGDDEGESIDN